MMGGHISVDSTIGSGSEFTVEIPVEISEFSDRYRTSKNMICSLEQKNILFGG